jgi:N-acetylglucosamine-6-phosphate deacetylase
MKYTLFTNAKLITPFEVIEPGEVLVGDGLIVNIGKAGTSMLAAGVETVDCTGQYITPGLFDTHIHGSIGYDFMTAQPEEMRKILRWLAARGITSLLPTLNGGPVGEMRQAMSRIQEVCQSQQPDEAKIYGIHLEGPFLNVQKSGAQVESAILPPSIKTLEELVAGFEDSVRLMTLAPESEEALELIHWLRAKNILVSLGHSMGTFQQSETAFQAGANRVAHLYNGMRAFDHREPGIIGAALTNETVFAELTLDGIHVHPAAAEIALRAKGIDRVILITDAMQAAGLPDGVYIRPGNRKTIVKDGAARVENGSLAGSVLTLDKALRYAVQVLGVSTADAVKMASYNVALSLNLENQAGTLAPGLPADFTLMDENLNHIVTYLNGSPLPTKDV